MLNFFIIILIAISLSMDTFSLSIIYGTLNLERRKVYLLSLIVGSFHFFMPMMGNVIGIEILDKLPLKPDVVVGIIFLIIAFQMLFHENEIIDLTKLYSLFIFALTVSIDSFSVGIGISNITSNFVLAYSSFAITSFIFTFIGLKFGKLLNYRLGDLSEKVGSIILLILGILYVF